MAGTTLAGRMVGKDLILQAAAKVGCGSSLPQGKAKGVPCPESI